MYISTCNCSKKKSQDSAWFIVIKKRKLDKLNSHPKMWEKKRYEANNRLKNSCSLSTEDSRTHGKRTSCHTTSDMYRKSVGTFCMLNTHGWRSTCALLLLQTAPQTIQITKKRNFLHRSRTRALAYFWHKGQENRDTSLRVYLEKMFLTCFMSGSLRI